MKNTIHYNLKKPDKTDVIKIDDLNYNADIIDSELNKRALKDDFISDYYKKNEVDGKLSTEVNKIDAQMADIVQVKQNFNILSANWVDDTGVSGFWIYDIPDADITSTTMVDVNIHLISLNNARVLKSVTESSNGSVRLYADSQPTTDIIADLKYIRRVGDM